MPCFDGRENRDRAHAAKSVPILCTYARKLCADNVPLSEWPAGLAEWWAEHKKIDREDER